MRSLVFALCVVALAACSDSKSTALTAPPLKTPAAPHVDSATLGLFAASMPLAARVAELVTRDFARVSLPADSFSLSADAVHPDIACPPASWNGARCWIMYTPYKNSDPSYENPAFLSLASDTAWNTPTSLRNPIVAYPGIGAYNSDPDHAFDPRGNRLVQVYRVVADTFNKIMIMSTANAKSWTTPRLAFKERNHNAVSPALVVATDRSTRMWYVRTGAEGCNATSSSVVMRTATPDTSERIDQADWSDAQQVSLSIPNAVIWHLDVAAVPGEGYIALVVAFTKGGSCSASDLWLASSRDGVAWRVSPMPMFWRGMSAARERSISTWYRGTLRYNAQDDVVDVWPSALAGQTWSIFHSSFKLADFINLVNTAQPSDLPALYASQAGISARIAMP